MKLTIKQMQEIKFYPNSIYNTIKNEFLYHSNKLEGSTFSRDNLEILADKRIVEGRHRYDDVIETTNSLDLFDYVVDTLGESLSKRLILEFHSILKNGTQDKELGLSGCWKKIPNEISGTGLKLSLPWEVDNDIANLLEYWNSSNKTFKDIMIFHSKFENIHPFQDGNGRIGRFIIIKQCIEENIDIITIDEKYSKEYKSALLLSQMHKDYNDLEDIFKKCQNFLEEKNELLRDTVKCLEINE